MFLLQSLLLPSPSLFFSSLSPLFTLTPHSRSTLRYFFPDISPAIRCSLSNSLIRIRTDIFSQTLTIILLDPTIALGLYAAFAAFAASSPVPGPDALGIEFSQVYVEKIAYAGSGYKAGSVKTSPREDWTAFALRSAALPPPLAPGYPPPPRGVRTVSSPRQSTTPRLSIYLELHRIHRPYTPDKDVKTTGQTDHWVIGAPQARATMRDE